MIEIALVAVSHATIHFDRLYSYKIPENLSDKIHMGSMVLIPFGKGNRCRMGIVLELQSQQEDNARLKEIIDVAPEESILTKELLQIVTYLKEKTFCTWFDAVKTVIPYGAQYRPELQKGKFVLKKQIVTHTQTEYYWCKPLPAKPKPTEKQKLAESILQQKPCTMEFLTDLGVSRAVIENLCKKGYAAKRQIDRSAIKKTYQQKNVQYTLSHEQQIAFDQIVTQMDGKPHTVVLHGVTASGKTILFIKLIEYVLQQGKQAIVLVPEIGLTPQMVQKLSVFFGEQVAIQHSALNNTQRLLQWIEIQKGKSTVVVGTRSAIFAPLDNVGLIIIDEEHDNSYHSESNPRYKAHDIAQLRSRNHGALVVLSSATPSIESYFYAQQGKYQLCTLKQRYSQQKLPLVQMVDMRQELMQGNISELSNPLRLELAQNLANGQQSILLLNKRGYQRVALCTQCAEVIKCSSCSVPMVYHKAKGKLLCHYCASSLEPVPTNCLQCGGKLLYTGFGTQKIEEELQQTFPQAKILRMDQDSTSKKDSHEILFQKFAQGEYQILIGTQMVAKGLDFPNVSLVGVLGIDQMLFSQGFRASERVFSLITQVVGRAGRSNLAGRAMIQTMDTANPILQLAASQDYTAFYQQEIFFRKISLYPPFCSICVLVFAGEKETFVAQAAREFVKILTQLAQKQPNIPLRVLGPTPSYVAMINKQYRYKVTIKCREDTTFRRLMQNVLEQYAQQGLSAKAIIALDFYSDGEM